MGLATGISWTDATWNPIRGCSRVSEGCRHCYAERHAYRFSGPGLSYEGLVQIGADGARRPQWNGKIKFVEEHLLDPLRWKKPRRIFVNSMSDLFHENVTDEMRDRIFAVMALCPQHTFQVLTKRPERILAYLTPTMSNYQPANVYDAAETISSSFIDREHTLWPLPNVQLGVSVEDQKTADERIPLLLQTPAWHHFISAEPLLGSVSLAPEWLNVGSIEVKMDQDLYDSLGEDGRERYIRKLQAEATHAGFNQLDWVIVGGESGAGARPMHPDWARSLRDQCKAAGVPFFFKQWGEWFGWRGDWNKTPVWDETHLGIRWPIYTWPEMNGWWSTSCGAKLSGCLLDGVEHHEFPAVSA
jgi:protein gp37